VHARGEARAGDGGQQGAVQWETRGGQQERGKRAIAVREMRARDACSEWSVAGTARARKGSGGGGEGKGQRKKEQAVGVRGGGRAAQGVRGRVSGRKARCVARCGRARVQTSGAAVRAERGRQREETGTTRGEAHEACVVRGVDAQGCARCGDARAMVGERARETAAAGQQCAGGGRERAAEGARDAQGVRRHACAALARAREEARGCGEGVHRGRTCADTAGAR